MDCREGLKQIPDESVDLILTDPPYGVKKKGIFGDENLEMFFSVLDECRRIIKPGKFLASYAATPKLPFVLNLNHGWQYYWTLCIYLEGCSAKSKVGFSGWTAVVLFTSAPPPIPS